MSGSQTSLEVFCSYVTRDRKLHDQLFDSLIMLRYQGLIMQWVDQEVKAGEDWQAVLDSRINSASIILMLISADYLASEYCYGIEMQRALRRQQEGQALVIPILLRPVDWSTTPFAHLQYLPSNARPIATWKNRDAAFVDVAAGIRRAIEAFSGRKPAAERAASAFPSIWHVPYERNPRFLDREDIFSRLHSRLPVEPQALRGPGGIGKTAVALEYAYRFAGEYDAVLWAQADSASTLIASYGEIANVLNLPEREDQEQATIIKAVRRWLQEHERWLLILDSVNDVELIRDFWPPAPKGHILLTSHISLLAGEIVMGTFSTEQGASYLLHRAYFLPVDDSLERATPSDRKIALQLARDMEGLPLALEQAGAYIELTGTKLADYQRLYKQLLSYQSQEESNLQHSFSSLVVDVSWRFIFQKLDRENPAAGDLLRLCAYLAPYDIPLELFSKGAHYLGGKLWPVASDPVQLAQAIEALRTYSLTSQQAEKSIALNQSVRTVMVHALPDDERDLWQQRAVLALDAAFPEVEPDTWLACEQLVPHVLHCAYWIERLNIVHLQAAYLFNQAALYLKTRGRYSEAEPLYERSLYIYEQLSGYQHPDTATSMNNLARLYVELGMDGQAMTYFQQALSIRRQQLGPTHLSTAVTHNDIALLYADKGKYTEARAHFRQALAIWDGTLGTQHPYTQQARQDYERLVPGTEQPRTSKSKEKSSQSRPGGD